MRVGMVKRLVRLRKRNLLNHQRRSRDLVHEVLQIPLAIIPHCRLLVIELLLTSLGG